MAIIFMDESGFTGEDLNNAAQPHFVIASSLVGDEEAGRVLRRCFPRYQGAEFKSSTILKRPAHREGLRAFARELPALADRTFLWIVDKRFSLLVKMFDYLVEPLLRAAGRDFYAGGYSMRYMNTVHRDILLAGGRAAYDEAVRLWDALARSPGAATMAALRAHLGGVARGTEHPLSTLFAMMDRGAQLLQAENPDLEGFAGTSEIQLTSVLSSVTHWRQRRTEDFDLVLDESTAFAKQRDLWDALTSEDFAPPPFAQANGTIVEFPLRVRSTTPARSQDSPAVQLCDLLAGLGAKLAPAFQQGSGERDAFLMELVLLGAGELETGGVRPHDAYADGPAPPAYGPDALDLLVGSLGPHLAARGKDPAAPR